MALLRLAMFHVRTGTYEVAVKALEQAFEKTVGHGQKIDIVFCLARLALFYERPDACRNYVVRLKGLLETGGDWERRNRHKVYEAILHLQAREFEQGAARFLETLSSFNADELFSYAQQVHYATLTGALQLERPQLREKLLESPEVRFFSLGSLSLFSQRDLQLRTVAGERPQLLRYVETLYDGEYSQFMTTLMELVDGMANDERLSRHAAWYGREMRIKAYAQFLQAYRTVSLAAMSSAFFLLLCSCFLARLHPHPLPVKSLACPSPSSSPRWPTSSPVVVSTPRSTPFVA